MEETLLAGVKNCATSWCSKFKKSERLLKPWLLDVSEKIKTKINLHKNSVGYKEVREVLKDQYCRRSLEELHEKYVIAPIDKATSNVAFICKRFYAQVLVKEVWMGKWAVLIMNLSMILLLMML